MGDFSSAAFVGLIMRQLAAAGIPPPAVVHPGGPPVVPLETKRHLLAHAWSHGGARFLLSIGQGIHHVSADPTLDVLRRASDPADLLQRWQRLEKYQHSRHRTRVIDSGPGRIRLHHASLTAEPPTLVEDLAVLGLKIALLQSIGCRSLDVAIADADRAVTVMRQDGFLEIPAGPLPAAEWIISWRQILRPVAPVPASDQRQNPVDQLYALLNDDSLKTWSVAEAAGAIGYSPRNLQRVLREQGASFSGILRDARVKRAARALLNSDASLAEIGYASGFADQAHFTREFRRIIGATPAEWRRVSTPQD